MVFTLETGNSVAWTKIVTAIEIRHLSGKKDLVVALDFRFGRDTTGAPPPKAPSIAKLGRQAKAEKLAREAKKVTDGEQKTAEVFHRNKDILMREWQCTKPTCANSGFWCWIRPSDGAHLQVDRANFVVWNAAIDMENGSATAERPPKEIHPLLPKQEKKVSRGS
jgi:hypothetical protein